MITSLSSKTNVGSASYDMKSVTPNHEMSGSYWSCDTNELRSISKLHPRNVKEYSSSLRCMLHQYTLFSNSELSRNALSELLRFLSTHGDCSLLNASKLSLRSIQGLFSTMNEASSPAKSDIQLSIWQLIYRTFRLPQRLNFEIYAETATLHIPY